MGRYRGEVVYLYAFDVAGEIRAGTLKEFLGRPVEQFAVDVNRRHPRQAFFQQPQMVRLEPQERSGPRGTVRVLRTVKILPIGAFCVAVRVSFEVDRLEELVVFHDVEFSDGMLHAEVRRLAEEARKELAPHCVRPVEQLSDEEAYTVFCFDAGPLGAGSLHFSAQDWLKSHRRGAAALLAQEVDVAQLSGQEAEESTGRWLSYYDDDLVVADWDAALIVDEPAQFDETLHVMELANLQLGELEVYDRMLDERMERAYRDLRGGGYRSRREVLQDLREIRVELAHFSDQLSNITKFFGDYHLARVYQVVAERFHLADLDRTLDEKLKVLDNLYEMLQQEQLNRWRLILEISIVVMFVLDLIILLLELLRQKPG